MAQQQLTTADRALLSADAKIAATAAPVSSGSPHQAFIDWHRQIAAGVAAAHPLVPTSPIRASGNHLAAQNDEPEPIDRGPLTQPAEIAEEDWLAAAVARNVDKGQRLARANDAAAIEAQLVDFRSQGLL